MDNSTYKTIESITVIDLGDSKCIRFMYTDGSYSIMPYMTENPDGSYSTIPIKLKSQTILHSF